MNGERGSPMILEVSEDFNNNCLFLISFESHTGVAKVFDAHDISSIDELGNLSNTNE